MFHANKKIEIMTLKSEFIKVWKKYIKQFEIETDLVYDYHAGNDKTGTLFFGDYVFSFHEIQYCIDNKLDCNILLEYFSHCLEYELTINFQSYLMGFRGLWSDKLKSYLSVVDCDNSRFIYILAFENIKNWFTESARLNEIFIESKISEIEFNKKVIEILEAKND